MVSEIEIWLILFLPLGSFLTIALVIRPFLNRYSRFAGYITILAIAAALGLSARALQAVISEGGQVELALHSWLSVGGLEIPVGILLDPLTAIMLVVVTGVSLMVQVYSTGYMRGDPGYARYFAYMSLFTTAMVGLVLSASIIQLYVFWELVGLCSYLLIGFWYHRPAAASAAKKAFIVTRLGDFGFLLAILYLYYNGDSFADKGLNPLVINDVYRAVALGGVISTSVATWIAVGIFAGAVGKSAQFPLHTWLPDAMEGPTPVSALIHAATMVTAGVFLVARFFPLFEMSEVALNTVAIIGGVTALFAASMGLVMNDIKRVLAYSTISQLGYMMLALGIGAYVPAMFHLFTHAFFKALLFLGAGSVNHASGTFDMRYMGGLRRVMPWTYATFLIGSLSLAGIFPLAGFWSKDEILGHAWGGGGGVSQFVFWLALISVFMTAFYIFRALFMTFEGEFRGGSEAEPDATGYGAGVHLAESPVVMAAPLVVLGVASVLAGFLANPTTDLGVIPIHWMTHLFDHGPVEVHTEAFNIPLAAISGAVAASGIALAYVMYVKGRTFPRIEGNMRPVHKLLSRKYYFDEAYEGIVTDRLLYGWAARSLDWADRSIVDGAGGYVGRIGRNVGRAIAQLQTGQVQGYGVAISIGVLVLFGFYLLFR